MDTINQALGHYEASSWFRYDGLSNHHPILYTGMFALVISIVGESNIEMAVFCFLLLQSALWSLMCAWSVGWMNRHGCGKVLVLCVLLAIAFVPVYCVHAITMWKDAPFCASLLVFALHAFEVATKQNPRTRDVLVLGLLGLLVAHLRNNGVFVVAATMLYALLVVPSIRKQLVVCLAAFVCAFAAIQGPLFAALGVQSSRFAESLGVPLQQIALVAKENGLNEEQTRTIDKVIPVEQMKEVYTPPSVNSIKFDDAFNDSYLENNKTEFLLTWFQIVTAHPPTALKAWVLLTEGIWGPGQTAEIGTPSSLNDASTKDLIGLGYNPREVFNKLQDHFPFLLGKGAMVWITAWFSLLALTLAQGQRLRRASVFIPGIALFATLVIAAPSGWDYRYVFYFTLFLPFTLFFVAQGIRERSSSRDNKDGASE